MSLSFVSVLLDFALTTLRENINLSRFDRESNKIAEY